MKKSWFHSPANNRTMRFIKNGILILLLVVGGWWLLSKLNLLPSLGDLLAPKAVQIDETATIVKDIQPLAQLVTLSAYNEIVVDSVVKHSRIIRMKQR